MENYRKYEPIFGSWKLKRKIGEGNFGAVFEIEREDFDVKYKSALKIITVPRTQNEVKNATLEGMTNENITCYFKQVVEDIAKEFALMSKLKGNSNIVSYEDHMVIEHTGEIGWDILIRMELLTPLTEYLQKSQFDEKDVIRVGMDICRALIICQKNNIVHRDIKLENIFISDNGDFKLGDFGIARQIEKTTNELSKKGTQAYMAPELYRGDKCTNSVDIYSLGIVLYRLLNRNRLPFLPEFPKPITFDDKEKATFLRMNGEKVPELKNVNKRLNDIVLKACEFDPKDRYKEPQKMYDELEQLLHTDFAKTDNTESARPPETAYTPKKSENSTSFESKNSDELELTKALIDENPDEFELTKALIDENPDEPELTVALADEACNEFEMTEVLDGTQLVDVNIGEDVKKKPKKVLIAAIAAAGVIAVAATAAAVSGVNREKQVPEIPVVSIEGVEDTLTVEMGYDMPLEVCVMPEDATDKEVKYKVTVGEEYLGVDEHGVVTPIGVGEGEVKISAGAIEKSVHITVIENREVAAQIEQGKALLIEKHNSAKQTLESIASDTSINQDTIANEKNMLMSALEGYDAKINAITKIEELSEYTEYYDVTVQGLTAGLSGAYSNAVQAEKDRKEAEAKEEAAKQQAAEKAKQKAKEQSKAEKKTVQKKAAENVQSENSVQTAPRVCAVCGSSAHTTHPEEKKDTGSVQRVCPVCGSSAHTTHPEEKINLNRNLLN